MHFSANTKFDLFYTGHSLEKSDFVSRNVLYRPLIKTTTCLHDRSK